MKCRTCDVELTDGNWYPSLKKTNVSRCKDCHRAINAARHKAHPEQARKRQRRWAEKHPKEAAKKFAKLARTKVPFIGDLDKEVVKCRKCGMRLTDENWQPCFRKRSVKRCRDCHNKLVVAWGKAHPEDAAKRVARWKARHPEHQPEYYRANKEAFAKRARSRLWKLKLAAFEKLGGECVVCGIKDPRILQINHIKGGGQKEKRFGMDMYAAIIDGTREIEDLDLRCSNHNLLYEYQVGRRKVPAGIHLGDLYDLS